MKWREFAWEYFASCIALAILAVLFLLTLTGCWQSEQRQASAFEVRGELNGQPVVLRIDGNAATVAHSGVDPAAVEALVSKAAGAAVNAALGPLTAVMKPAEPSGGFDPGLAGALTAAAGTAGLALAKTLEARANRRDADEGWKLAHDNALKVPTNG